MASQPTTSERFNAPDADVTIKSIDGVQFSLHRKYLAANTGAFPPMEIETAGEIVNLTEDAATLELLFQFIYPQRHPSLDGAPYKVVAPLAEAAEKYEVFAAMNICRMKMVNFLPAHAKGIMAYAAKHGYRDIVDKAAPLAVPLPIRDVVQLLPQHLAVQWLTYRQQLNDILLTAITSQPDIMLPLSNCHACGYPANGCRSCTTIPHMSSTLGLDLKLSSLFSLSSMVSAKKLQHPSHAVQIDNWYRKIRSQLDSVQKFSTYI